jgi:spore maturation protein CgeB
VYENSSIAVAKAVNDAAGADILIKASGVGVFDEFIEKALVEIKKPRQTIIFWDVDAPATLDSVFSGTKQDFKNLIPQYDYVFTYGGGNPVVDAYRSLNVKKCIPIYNALDPETHFRVPVHPDYECDLAFLGNRLPDREERVYEFFIDVASKLPDHRFMLGGSGWDINSLPPNIKYVGHVYTKDHNAFNSSPKVVLNISRQSMADYGFSPATRVFEAAGAGACIITDFWAGVEKFFVPESEIWVAHEGYDVVSLLKWIDSEEAVKTGNAALAKVLSEHTYQQRAQQIDDILLGKKTFAANK